MILETRTVLNVRPANLRKLGGDVPNTGIPALDRALMTWEQNAELELRQQLQDKAVELSTTILQGGPSTADEIVEQLYQQDQSLQKTRIKEILMEVTEAAAPAPAPAPAPEPSNKYEAYRLLLKSKSANLETAKKLKTFTEALEAGTLDILLAPFFQRDSISASVTAPFGNICDCMAEFFHLPADVYRTCIHQRIGLEAAIEQHETNEDLHTVVNRRRDNMHMSTFFAAAEFCLEDMESQHKELETELFAKFADEPAPEPKPSSHRELEIAKFIEAAMTEAYVDVALDLMENFKKDEELMEVLKNPPVCTITQETPVDRVLASDGEVYDRGPLLTWLAMKCESPVTRKTIRGMINLTEFKHAL
eukprot:SAG11_NODE_5292_length_1604_cov_1.628571_1_plen_363_part_00